MEKGTFRVQYAQIYQIQTAFANAGLLRAIFMGFQCGYKCKRGPKPPFVKFHRFGQNQFLATFTVRISEPSISWSM